MTSPVSSALLLTIISMISLSTVRSVTDQSIPDPCDNYSVLNEPWRATNVTTSKTQYCDQSVKWAGWYRLMYQGQDVQMPESCVAKSSCSTDAPLWLNGSHPQLLDGVVTRSVCGHWNTDCCNFKSNPIRVKACPGIYYVYEFVSPSACNLVYCADISTVKPVPYIPPPIRNLAGLRMRLSSANDVSHSPKSEIFVSQFKDRLVGKGLPLNITVRLRDISAETLLTPMQNPGTC